MRMNWGTLGPVEPVDSRARPAVPFQQVDCSTGSGAVSQPGRASSVRHRALLVDLNNFASFPALAVGILISGLRNAGHDVRLLSPLAYDVPASVREKPDRLHHHWMRRLHLSTLPGGETVRDLSRAVYFGWQRRPHPTVIREVRRALASKPDVLLLSAYLQHYETVVELGRLAQEAGVPLLLGGPAFNFPETADAWCSVPGLSAIFGGEADLVIADLVEAVVQGRNLLRFAGILLPDGRRGPPAPPLRDLDRVPVPDFQDFP